MCMQVVRKADESKILDVVILGLVNATLSTNTCCQVRNDSCHIQRTSCRFIFRIHKYNWTKRPSDSTNRLSQPFLDRAHYLFLSDCQWKKNLWFNQSCLRTKHIWRHLWHDRLRFHSIPVKGLFHSMFIYMQMLSYFYDHISAIATSLVFHRSVYRTHLQMWSWTIAGFKLLCKRIQSIQNCKDITNTWFRQSVHLFLLFQLQGLKSLTFQRANCQSSSAQKWISHKIYYKIIQHKYITACITISCYTSCFVFSLKIPIFSISKQYHQLVLWPFSRPRDSWTEPGPRASGSSNVVPDTSAAWQAPGADRKWLNPMKRHLRMTTPKAQAQG